MRGQTVYVILKRLKRQTAGCPCQCQVIRVIKNKQLAARIARSKGDRSKLYVYWIQSTSLMPERSMLEVNQALKQI